MSFGYGICGHKNSFSTTSLVGNWVEDEFGRQLAANPNRGLEEGTPASEHRSQYISPAEMVDKQPRRIEPDPLLNGRDGLTAAMMFHHGPADSKAPFIATSMTKIGSIPDATVIMGGRTKQLEDERTQLEDRTTEAKAASMNVLSKAFVIDEGDLEPLPIFTRRKPLLK